MELISAQRQRVWKVPAVVNFSCGGIGTGLYLVDLLLLQPPGPDWLQSLIRSAPIKLLGPVLVGFGFLALTSEAGRPMRGVNLFRHLRRSWMSRETLAAAIFIPAAGLDWLLPNPVLRAIAAAAALALLLCQGFIVYRARGVTAWNNPLMPVFFATSGFATGSGLAILMIALYNSAFAQGIQANIPLGLVGLVSAVLNGLVWLVYLRTTGDGFQKATVALRRPDRLALIIGVGHLLPVMLLAAGWFAGASGGFLLFIQVLSGAALVFGGVSQKFGIIIEAGYLRPINLPVPLKRSAAKGAEIQRVRPYI